MNQKDLEAALLALKVQIDRLNEVIIDKLSDDLKIKISNEVVRIQCQTNTKTTRIMKG